MEELIYKILESQNDRCPNCGGNYEKGECKFCNSINKKSEELISDLEKLLNGEKEYSKDEYVLLSLLHKYNIESLNKVLEKHNINPNTWIEYYNTIIKGKDKLSIFDIKVLITLISNKLINEDIMVKFNTAILKNIHINAKEGQYLNEIFAKNVIENIFKEMCMSFEIYAPTLKFIDIKKEEERVAYVNGSGDIRIDNTELKNFINGDIVSLYSSLMHELCHIYQFEEMRKKDNDVSVFIKALDNIIVNKNNKYYKDNYLLISYEIEAFFTELESTNYMVNKTGLTELADPQINEKLSNLNNKYNNIYRKYNDEVASLIDIANKYVAIHEYNYYPIVRKFYKVVGDKVVLKDREEFINDNKDNESFIKFYDTFISKKQDIDIEERSPAK